MDFAAALAKLERSVEAARRPPAKKDNDHNKKTPAPKPQHQLPPTMPFQKLQQAGYRIVSAVAPLAS
jgi:hypothetical protein